MRYAASVLGSVLILLAAQGFVAAAASPVDGRAECSGITVEGYEVSACYPSTFVVGDSAPMLSFWGPVFEGTVVATVTSPTAKWSMTCGFSGSSISCDIPPGEGEFVPGQVASLAAKATGLGTWRVRAD